MPGSNRAPNGQFLKGTHWRPHAIFREREYLLREYFQLKRSTGDIAKDNGVTDNAIIFWLKRHGIVRRTTAQARSIKYWGVSGSDNPMFGRTGQANPHYIDGSSPERQSAYANAAGRAWRRAVLKRDEYKCVRCGDNNRKPKNLHVHHLNQWAGNPDLRFDIDNGMTLCRACHEWVHSRENTNRELLR